MKVTDADGNDITPSASPLPATAEQASRRVFVKRVMRGTATHISNNIELRVTCAMTAPEGVEIPRHVADMFNGRKVATKTFSVSLALDTDLTPEKMARAIYANIEALELSVE